MELGSAEHKQILLTNIIKVSVKVATLGLLLGGFLMIPSLIRDNAFSLGLLYLGSAITLGSSIYALFIAIKKYNKIIKPFDQQYRNHESDSNPNSN